MPAHKNRAQANVPRYLCHDSGGRKRAFCYAYEDGKRRRVYLGTWNSPESKQRYLELLSPSLDDQPEDRERNHHFAITIEELVARFLIWAKGHYVTHGKQTGKRDNMRDAAGPLLALFRDESASDFGPKRLRMVRDLMLRPGNLARRTINHRVQRIRRIFRWGVSEELVPVRVWESLRTLLPLQRGRTSARETEPIRPVPLNLLQKTLPHLTPTVKTIVLIQCLTGMRPNEVVQMRMADIEFEGPDGCWVFLPRTHKTEHRSRSRRVVLSNRVQSLLTPFVTEDPEAFLFSPIRSEAERQVQRRKARVSKVTPSQEARGEARQKSPGRKLRDAWTNASYLRAIYYACDRAKIERWSPGRLRHTFEDLAEKSAGLEAASKALNSPSRHLPALRGRAGATERQHLDGRYRTGRTANGRASQTQTCTGSHY